MYSDDIEARHLFFYFFESRRDPATDDVVMWTNGGPGSSSALGLFMELGKDTFCFRRPSAPISPLEPRSMQGDGAQLDRALRVWMERAREHLLH